MIEPSQTAAHRAQHVQSARSNPMLPPADDLIRVGSRRWFRHLGIEMAAHWTNLQGRPTPIVTEGGEPIEELF